MVAIVSRFCRYRSVLESLIATAVTQLERSLLAGILTNDHTNSFQVHKPPSLITNSPRNYMKNDINSSTDLSSTFFCYCICLFLTKGLWGFLQTGNFEISLSGTGRGLFWNLTRIPHSPNVRSPWRAYVISHQWFSLRQCAESPMQPHSQEEDKKLNYWEMVHLKERKKIMWKMCGKVQQSFF